uniref:Uncharacterized protein n=1 Tax=Utricularia reniformis TaxID=192314 RepID=A0A1Y0B4E3_9LAMI|nr:hypothetical protein AEK19_MT2179 [Utricularia reniformis]ART32326.1 hypothetical protein AEK19_MT2179 [Utricularia reniformis]
MPSPSAIPTETAVYSNICICHFADLMPSEIDRGLLVD